MKESKAVYVTKRDIKDELNRDNNLYAYKVTRDREFLPDPLRYDQKTQEVGCQYEGRRNNLICTCKNLATLRHREEVGYFGLPKQIYAYHRSKSFTDIGVGSVKAVQRKKVKRIYLPETDDRGVGSSDLSSFLIRRSRQPRGGGYYDNKRTSSKCVGGILEYNIGCVMNEKLSPIVQTVSGSTSPRDATFNRNIEIGSNTVVRSLTNTTTQVEDTVKKKVEMKIEEIKPVVIPQENPKEIKTKTVDINKPKEEKQSKTIETEKYSSDSLVQHIHNLENPSDEKQSHLSIDPSDPMENQLEREYRRIFAPKSKEEKSSNDKPIPDFKSTSTLKRRFEALRRGLAKKEESKKNAVIVTKVSSPRSAASRKDVSINSDPPSLEGKSYSNTKTYSPVQQSYSRDKSVYNPTISNYRRCVTGRNERGSAQWSSRQDDDDSECQGVKGMFKLWGKKFNLEEDKYKRHPTPKPSREASKKMEKKIEESKVAIKTDEDEKKQGRKFFFFKKKNKDSKERPYKAKKGITTGRCEVRDGLMIKIGCGGSVYVPEQTVKEPEIMPEDYEDMVRKAWLKKYLTHAIESTNSVQVRWNNKTYATSSSTIFELMDNVYKDTGVAFRSKSQVTVQSSYKFSTKHHVNFLHQNIEAWMIPKTLINRPLLLPAEIKCKSNEERKDNMEVSISDQKWFIDKSKAFSHKIEVVLHSKNFVKLNKEESSEYLRIDIPKGFFVDSSSDDGNKNPANQSSDEEVYKIVEYETGSDLKKDTTNRSFDVGDHKQNNIKVTVSVKESTDCNSKILETLIKRPPGHRDVVIQGSNVYIPKRCNVIGVGIITQRDLREIRKPLLKIQDDFSDEESDHIILRSNQKKCEFAESYLQDYYRNWTPLGIDLYSWCVSDSHLRCCSENSKVSFNNQGDGTKSCPNIFDDFQTSTIVSSCGASSCSQCHACDHHDKAAEKHTWFGKFKKKPNDSHNNNGYRRVLPKDSIEVVKRRRLYAASNKSKWANCPEYDKPYSVPSIESRGAQNTTTVECPKQKKSCCKPIEPKPRKRTCKKHVSLPDCDTMNNLLAKQLTDSVPEGILAFKGTSGCDTCKKKGICPKHAKINAELTCEISRAPCRDSREMMKKAPCTNSKASCEKPPSSTSSIPSCKKPSSCLPSPLCEKSSPSLQPSRNPPSCPPTPSSYPKPPSCPLTPRSCPPSPPPCKRKPPTYPESPPPSKKPPSCPPSPCNRSPCPISLPAFKKKPLQSPPPCDDSTPCPPSPPYKKPSSHPPTCPHSPPPYSHPPPSHAKSSPSPASRSPPCYPKSKPCPASPLSCPATPPSCCSVDPNQYPVIPPPCKKASINICKKLSPFFKRKTQICPASPPSKPTPCKHSFCKALACQPSPCDHPSSQKPPSTPSACEKFSTTSCSYGTRIVPDTHQTPDAPYFYSPIHPCPPEYEKPKKIAAPCKSPPCNKQLTQCQPSQCNPQSIALPEALCDQCRTSADDFPWPTKNQISNQSSMTSLYAAQQEEPAYGTCNKNCPMMPKLSCDTIPSPKNECKKSCPNRQGSQRPPCMPEMQCPPVQLPTPFPEPTRTPPPSEVCKNKSKGKMSGLFLKMLPGGNKKKTTCSKDCLAWESGQAEDGCISLNSEEKITIRLKTESPSTEEIREGLNIKVQDEDGMTLFERKEYRHPQATCSMHSQLLLGEMYKASEVRRVTTSNSVQAIGSDKDCHKEVVECRSRASIANLIEIQFKLKVTQGAKTTEINIANDDDKEKERHEQIGKEDRKKTSQEVFVVNNESERPVDHSDQKNDINIRIVIKNFKPKSGKKKSVNIKRDDYSKDFSKKISAKFHTVSTGYSDIIHDDNVFSVHRATVDLTSSVDKSKTHSNRSEEIMSEALIEHGRDILLGSEMSICRCMMTNMSEGRIEDFETVKSVPSKKYSENKETQQFPEQTYAEKPAEHKYDTEETDTDKPADLKYDTEDTDTDKPLEPKYDTEGNDTDKPVEPKYDTFMSTDTDEQDAIPEQEAYVVKSKSLEVIVKPHTKEEKKEMLKHVFEKAHGTKTKNKTRIRKLRDMLKVILTSDSSDHDETKLRNNELANDVAYASFKPNYFRDSDSMNNYYRTESTLLSEGEINRQVVYPTGENNSECSNSNPSDVLSSENESPNRDCMCSTLAARLKLASRIGDDGGCCCATKTNTSKNEETTCDLKKESDESQYNYKTAEYVDVETQHSRYLTSQINSTNLSLRRSMRSSITGSVNMQNQIIADAGVINVNDRNFNPTRNSFSSRMNHVRECEMRKLNRNTFLSISDEDKIVLLSSKPTRVSAECNKANEIKQKYIKTMAKLHASDILQSYETKKAVLEIYTEKTVSDEGEHLVAKLPKFVYDRENEIQTNYAVMATNSYKTVCKRNIVMMTINR